MSGGLIEDVQVQQFFSIDFAQSIKVDKLLAHEEFEQFPKINELINIFLWKKIKQPYL